jgi:ribonucleoside-diphosphate reductase alpha chain
MQYQEVGVSAVAGTFPGAVVVAQQGGIGAALATSYADYKVIRRNGAVVGFEPAKIAVAMTKAFLAVRGGQGAASAAVREQVERLTDVTIGALVRRRPAGGTFHIEDVQDQVELSRRWSRKRRNCRCSKTASGSRSTWRACKR